MKKISILIAAAFTVLSATAQYGRQYYNNSTVTVKLNGNNSNKEQVYIDGRNYTSSYGNGNNNKKQKTEK